MPEGFRLRFYQPGDEAAWAALEYGIGDFDPQEEARAYFVQTYGSHAQDLARRCLFAVGQPPGYQALVDVNRTDAGFLADGDDFFRRLQFKVRLFPVAEKKERHYGNAYYRSHRGGRQAG